AAAGGAPDPGARPCGVGHGQVVLEEHSVLERTEDQQQENRSDQCEFEQGRAPLWVRKPPHAHRPPPRGVFNAVTAGFPPTIESRSGASRVRPFAALANAFFTLA